MPLEQSYPADGLTSVEIEIRRGDMTIEQSPDSQVLVADFSGGALDVDLRVDQTGDTLRIIQTPVESDRDRGGIPLLNDLGLGQLVGQVGRIDLRLRVPATIRRFAVTTGLGSVQVAPWFDNVKVTTGKGEVNLTAGGAQVDVKCGMGSVRIGRIGESGSIQTGMGEVLLGGGEGKVRIQTGKGTVRISDANLTLDANTGMGEVRLERVSGEGNIRTGFGQLLVSDARNLALEAHTGNGELRLSGEFRSIRAKSGFGAIFCNALKLGGVVDLNTGNGEIDVAFGSDGAVRIDAATGRGRIDSEVPLVQVGQTGPEGFFSRRVVGTTGVGEIQSTVRLRSGIGNIRLRHLGGASAQAGTIPAQATASSEPSAPPASAPTTGRTRLEVLQSLQRGEIGIDEAERLLTAR